MIYICHAYQNGKKWNLLEVRAESETEAFNKAWDIFESIHTDFDWVECELKH